MIFICKPYHELSLLDIYKILHLRSEVFVVEQNCIYQDIDNKDIESDHLMGWDREELVAYARVLRPGLSYPDYSSIGRVCTKKTYRHLGWGIKLMEAAISQCETLYPDKTIKISAQSYLLKFYSDLGFKKTGNEYLEDNIPHSAMLRV